MTRQGMTYKRSCPNCKKEIVYSTRWFFLAAEKKGGWCKHCTAVEAGKRVGKSGLGIKLSPEAREARCGSGNPFYGKHHSKETKEKLRSQRKGQKIHTQEHKEALRISMAGEKNPHHGKSLLEMMVTKYGEEEANKRYQIWREGQKGKFVGPKNGMFGKSPPKGAGCGWGGWYKGWFFRSLLELSYMIQVIEKERGVWRTGESSDLRIKYIDENGRQRTYTADFLINERYLVELKPQVMVKTEIVNLKAQAAMSFCREKNLIYILTSVKLIPREDLEELHASGTVKFLPKWEKRYQCWKKLHTKISSVTEISA